MRFLTPGERRAIVVVALLFAIGAGRDLWRAVHPRALPRVPAAAGGVGIEGRASMKEEAPGGAARDPTPVREGNGAPPSPREAGVPGGMVDLNRATVEELDRLPGLGPVLARRIVEHRQRHRFHDVEELLAVRGIGPKLLERLRGHVVAGPP